MGKRKLSGFMESDILNSMIYTDYYNRLKLWALSMFEWENVPDSMDARFLELSLYENGQALIAYDDIFGVINTRVAPAGELNLYNMPIAYSAYASNGYMHTFDIKDCVYIRNNYLCTPTDSTIQLFALRLYELQRSADVNVKAQKTPVLIIGNEDERLALKNVYMQYDGNQPVIYGEKDLNNNLRVLKTDAPFTAPQLHEMKMKVLNEVLTFLGINNANTDKKERLITDEVEANNQLLDLASEVMLLTRQQACEQANKMYGLNLNVRLRKPRNEEVLDIE